MRLTAKMISSRDAMVAGVDRVAGAQRPSIESWCLAFDCAWTNSL